MNTSLNDARDNFNRVVTAPGFVIFMIGLVFGAAGWTASQEFRVQELEKKTLIHAALPSHRTSGETAVRIQVELEHIQAQLKEINDTLRQQRGNK